MEALEILLVVACFYLGIETYREIKKYSERRKGLKKEVYHLYNIRQMGTYNVADMPSDEFDRLAKRFRVLAEEDKEFLVIDTLPSPYVVYRMEELDE